MIFLRGRIIGCLECGCTQLGKYLKNLESAIVISRDWRRFQDDDNVSRCYSIDHPRFKTPNKERYLEDTAKKILTAHSIKPVSSALISHWYDSFKADCVQTLRANWSICCHIFSIYCNSLSSAVSLEQRVCIVDTTTVGLCDFFRRVQFCMQFDSRLTFIRKAPGTRYYQDNIIERHRLGGARLLVREGGGIFWVLGLTCMFKLEPSG
ncbi:uncharacterized protein TNCV_3964361 [Trichonephila clavipes]|nr:uncharacterized protein TNCV_3964361 [Trichonephila clavipes]